MPQISVRSQSFGESVIRGMSRVAAKYGAVNLAQGFPDFDPPEELTRALATVSGTGPHQYAVTWGAANFRKALAEKQSRFMGLPIDPETDLVVTCGSTEAMMAAMMTVCNPGDKVIVFSPFYENYVADMILCGAEPVYVSLHHPDFVFDQDELRAAFERGVKAIVVCNPSNPTGKVFTRDELACIAGLAQEFDTFVIVDEVYEHIVYEPFRHTYMSSLPGMWNRTLSVSSLSKTYSITGWRLGYVLGAEKNILGARKVHDFLTVGAAAPLQEAAVAALQLPQSYYEGLERTYALKRELFCKGLEALGFMFWPVQGAYYVMVDISEFGTPDTAFCEWLARVVGVAAVPGSSFFREPVTHFIRFHFAKNEATLRDALTRLSRMRELWLSHGI